MLRKYYELGGKLYEAVTACGLEDLNAKYTWNPPLLLMHIVPDFVIPNEENPKKVILVTHSTSSFGTKMKFLRNIEELFEIKTRISPACVALNIVYSSERGWKAQLLDIFEKVFDGNLIVFRKEYGAAFLNLLHKIVLKGMKDLSFEEAKTKVKEAIVNNSDLKKVYQAHFLRDLDKLLHSSLNEDLLLLWKKEYDRTSSAHEFEKRISIRDTFFKRGLLNTLFLTTDELEYLSNWAKISESQVMVLEGKLKEFFPHLQDLGLVNARKTLFGKEANLDKALFFILKRMTLNKIKSFHEFALQRYPKLKGYIFKLKDTAKLRKIIRLLCREWRRRTSMPIESLICKMLKTCDEYSQRLKVGSTRNWILETIMDIIRYFKPDIRYSYDVLSRESDLPMIGGFSPIPMFVRGEKKLTDDELERVSMALGNHMRSINTREIEANIDGIVHESCRHTFITLAKHRTINLLKLLILRKLQESGCQDIEEGVRVRSVLAEYSGAPVGTADSTYTFQAKKANMSLIVDAIAAYAQTHKHKEMSARVRMSRYKWKEDTKEFSERKEIDRWILVLDGPWKELSGERTKFYEMLLEAGWDFITYPDQLSRIINQLGEER